MAVACAACRNRIILLLDLDCFYVQCAIKSDPSLAGRPVGIQQKAIVVTCSYEARAHGVTKLMSITDARALCPALVLVNGEELSHFRACSAAVASTVRATLERYGLDAPLERVGMDECFIDVSTALPSDASPLHTDAVRAACARLGIAPTSGDDHVYTPAQGDADGARDHCVHALRLGACIASDLRACVLARTGFTSSVGVSSSKLAAKLAAGMHKPRAQTTLYPWHVRAYLATQDVRVIPGVGFSTAIKLNEAGIHTCAQLARVTELPPGVAPRVQRLCSGEDDEPVKHSGAPITVSDEDSFKRIASLAEAHAKLVQLVTSLLPRIDAHYAEHHEWPRSVRVTLRHVGVHGKVTRSAPVPADVAPPREKRARVESDSAASAREGAHAVPVPDPRIAALVRTAAPLMREMLGGRDFHITLMNVAVTSFHAGEGHTGSRSIADMFAKNATAAAVPTPRHDVIVISDDEGVGAASAQVAAVRSSQGGSGSIKRAAGTLSTWLQTDATAGIKRRR